ncbi:hypothetical protein PoB_002078500 [Plakobranchus ocellatus]|uniref:Uncharacterized protein n=1 Tax=Plakobranchus ocellatus TaxID=259542 RepID=A0AAV3ZFA0_9GAST|nr:hypothetical protein PoB_002078500 [Plakobranchus ocellatus]
MCFRQSKAADDIVQNMCFRQSNAADDIVQNMCFRQSKAADDIVRTCALGRVKQLMLTGLQIARKTEGLQQALTKICKTTTQSHTLRYLEY